MNHSQFIHHDRNGRPVAATCTALKLPREAPYIARVETQRDGVTIWSTDIQPPAGSYLVGASVIVPHDATTTLLVHYDDGDTAIVGPMD